MHPPVYKGYKQFELNNFHGSIETPSKERGEETTERVNGTTEPGVHFTSPACDKTARGYSSILLEEYRFEFTMLTILVSSRLHLQLAD